MTLNDLPSDEELSELFSVYCYYGFAAHRAQELEQTLINLAAFLQLERPSLRTQTFLADPYAKLDRGTMGQVIKALKKLLDFDSSLDAQLCKALEARNQLAHRFFANEERLLTASGREQMISELRNLSSVITKANSAARQLLVTALARFGYSEQDIEREHRRWWKRVRGSE